MIAHTDENLNTGFDWNFPGAPPPMFVNARAPGESGGALPLPLLLEPGFNAYALYPSLWGVSVFSAPALIPTAQVGVNPWDHIFGPIGGAAGTPMVPALDIAPQTSSVSMQ